METKARTRIEIVIDSYNSMTLNLPTRMNATEFLALLDRTRKIMNIGKIAEIQKDNEIVEENYEKIPVVKRKKRNFKYELKPIDEEQFVKEYVKGTPMYKLIKKYCVGNDRGLEILHKYNIPVRGLKWKNKNPAPQIQHTQIQHTQEKRRNVRRSKKFMNKIYKEYLLGEKIKSLSVKYNVPNTTLVDMVNRKGRRV